MERNREGRRGGNGSANVSSSRRLRTSIVKDVSEDESQNSRLQKSRKDGLYSRKRRNCRSSHEESQQLLHTGQSDERDESFEDTAMAASEEDADLQPPAIRRGSGKLKIHMKARVDVSNIDMAVVPRKLRTAMMRRYPDLTSPHDAETRKDSNIDITAAPTCSTTSLKPGRRKRPNIHKLRHAKFRKVSPTMISEQEAEVAETLFDLARMVSSQAISSISEVKSERTSEMKLGPSPAVSPLSPVQDCSSPVVTASSPSFNHTLGALGGSKGKQPQASSTSEDAGQAVTGSESIINGNSCFFTSSMGVGTDLADPEQAADGNRVQTESSTSHPAEFSMIASTAVFTSTSTSTNVSLAPPQIPQTIDKPTFQDNNIPHVESSNDKLIENVPSTSMLAQSNGSPSSLGDIRNVGETDMPAVESSIVKEASTEVGVENRIQQYPPARSVYPGNFEIDLMASPKSVDEVNGIRDSNKIDIKEEQEVDLTTIPTAENSITDVQRCEKINETKNVQMFEWENPIIQKVEPGWNKGWEVEKTIEQFKEMPNQSHCLKDKPKQELATAKNTNGDSRVQIGDRPATVMMTTSNTMTSTTLPISMGVTGWPGGLPPLGYYSPMAAATAAAWRSSLPLTGPSTLKNITPSPQPFLQMQQSRKRSATHVYISLFIGTHQQLMKNPLWAAAYGAKAYNLNIPMAPDGLMGVSVGSDLGPEIRTTRFAVGSISGSGYGMTAVAKDASFNTYIDVAGRQPLLQQQTHTSQQEPTSFPQAGPVFVHPATNSASISAAGNKAVGGSVGTSEEILGTGSSASHHGSSVCVVPAIAEGAMSNGSVSRAAAVQTQHLNSVIGHNTFPYTFPRGQFGPLFNGHLSPQQVSQYYSNPFVGPHFVQPSPPPQQSQGVSNLMPEVSVSQKQRDSQGASRLPSSVSADQHHHSLSTNGDSSQHLEHISKKEKVTVNGISMAEMKSTIPRNIYGQNFSSLQVPSMNFPSAILAAGMPTFPMQLLDLKQMGSLTGKHSGKMDQQAQTDLQSHSQSKLTLQQQQQYHTQAQGPFAGGVEDIKISVTEGSYSSGCKEDRKSNGKYELNQSNKSRVDLEASPTKDASSLPSVAGSHINIVAPICSSVSTPDKQFYQSSKHMVNHKTSSSSNRPLSPPVVESSVASLSEKTPTQSATYGKMPPGQGFLFPGHSVSSSGQGARQGDTLQQQGILSQQPLAGSLMPVAVTSGSPSQATLTSMAKTQGLLPKSSQSATNVIPISRLPPASSISSPVATPNGISVRDSLSIKSSSGATAAKKSSLSFTPNTASVLSSGPLAQNLPLKPSQAHFHQQLPYLMFQQNVQPMDSSQQQQLPLEQQQYPLPYNQQQAVQVQNQSLAQQTQLQFRPHLLTQKSPQYLQLQSHIHEQAPSQPSMIYLQKTVRQMNQQSGQMSSQPRHLGNMQQQALELQQQQQKLPTPPTSFSNATNGSLPATSSLCLPGNNPETMISYGAVISQATSARPLTPTKLASEINMSVVQKGNSAGPAFVLGQRDPSNLAPSSQQQISNSWTNSDTNGKVGENPVTGN